MAYFQIIHPLVLELEELQEHQPSSSSFSFSSFWDFKGLDPLQQQF